MAGVAFLIAMVGAASGILGVLYLLFRDDGAPSDEPKKDRKRLLVSNWK